MKKIGLGILIGGALAVLVVSVALALPSNKGIDKAPPEFVGELPESKLTKVVFIRFVPGFQKEKPCNYDGICDPDEKWQFCSDCSKPGGGEEEPTAACYGFLAGSKPRWNWVENYYYSTSELGTTSAWATERWDEVTSATIFGNGIPEPLRWGVYDYKNSISFGNHEDPNVIAVTAIWFRAKNIYEYDIMFDTDFFPGTGAIDLDTVALHEFGHGAGLDDLYDVACVSEVMYGIYDGVDLDLGPGDTTGIQILYGI